MGLKDRLRKLKRSAEGEMIVIAQRDGTSKAFEKMYAMSELFLIRYHAALGEEHHSEFTAALEGATEESRRAIVESLSSGAFVEDLEPATSPVEDLSEWPFNTPRPEYGAPPPRRLSAQRGIYLSTRAARMAS